MIVVVDETVGRTREQALASSVLILQRLDPGRQLPDLRLKARPGHALAGRLHRQARDDAQLVLVMVEPVLDGCDVRLDGGDIAPHGEDMLAQQVERELLRHVRQHLARQSSPA